MKQLINRIKGNKSLVNGTLFSVFSFIDRGISFFLMIILAKYIMPAEYGYLSLFSTVATFLGFFVTLSCQGFFSVSFFQRKGELFRKDATSILLIMTVCTSILSVVLLFSQGALSRMSGLPPFFLWIAVIISFTQILFYFYKDFLRIQEKVFPYGLASCGFAIINFILSVFLVVTKDLNWEGRVYAQLISTVAFGLFGTIVLLRNKVFAKHVTWEGTKMILLWGIPLIPHHATVWIKQGCDRFIINSTHTIEDVGVFSFAITLTSIIIMIGEAFNATNSVTMYQILSSDKSNEDKKIELKRQVKNIGIIYSLGYLAVLISVSLLVPFALPKYSGSLPYFYITSVSGYLQCLYYLYVNPLFYYHRNKDIMIVTFLTALVHLGLSLILTRYSLYLTACIYVISQGCVSIIIAMRSKKIVTENLTN